MKIPNGDSLNNIRKFNNATKYSTILIVMLDGTTGQYENEGYIHLIKKFTSEEDFRKSFYSGKDYNHVFIQTFTKNDDLLVLIKSKYPKILKIYIGDLL